MSSAISLDSSQRLLELEPDAHGESRQALITQGYPVRPTFEER